MRSRKEFIVDPLKLIIMVSLGSRHMKVRRVKAYTVYLLDISIVWKLQKY